MNALALALFVSQIPSQLTSILFKYYTGTLRQHKYADGDSVRQISPEVWCVMLLNIKSVYKYNVSHVYSQFGLLVRKA